MNIYGTAGPDTLSGTAESDLISGGEGNDALQGGAGGDTFYGGNGDDSLTLIAGSPQANTSYAYGGEGADILGAYMDLAAGGSMRLYGEAGDDVFAISMRAFGGSTMVADGGDGADRFVLTQGRATLTGGAGQDTFALSSQYGFHSFTPESFRITDFQAGNAGDKIDLSLALGTLGNWSGANPFTDGHIRAIQDGADTLLQVDYDGGANSFQVFFTLVGVTAAALTAFNFNGINPAGGPIPGSALVGTSGANNLQGGVGDDLIQGLEGNDDLKGGKGADHLEGGDGNDRLDGQQGDDVIDGGGGDDFIFNTGGGADILNGDDGSDQIFLDEGANVQVFGGAGSDSIRWLFLGSTSSTTHVTLSGGDDPDSFLLTFQSAVANAPLVEVSGDGGDDVIILDHGRYTLAGGAGRDTYQVTMSYQMSSDPAQSSLFTIKDFTPGASGDIIDFSRMSAHPFSSGQLRLVQMGVDLHIQISTVGSGAPYIDFFLLEGVRATDLVSANFDGLPIPAALVVATAGPDVLTGGAGADTLSGGAGDDVIKGGAGNDVLSGGADRDTVDFTDVTTSIVGNAATTWVSTGDGFYDQVTGMEVWRLGSGNDTLITYGAQETVYGGAGNDWVGDYGVNQNNIFYGEDGDDSLYGLGGSDTLWGGTGADFLVGGDGNDYIVGGAGIDWMDGQGGADTFFIYALSEIQGGWEAIANFQSGVDKLNVQYIDADGNAGNGDTAFTVTTTGFTNTAGQIYIERPGGQNYAFVRFDTNGDSVADALLFVTGTALTSGDFIL